MMIEAVKLSSAEDMYELAKSVVLRRAKSRCAENAEMWTQFFQLEMSKTKKEDQVYNAGEYEGIVDEESVFEAFASLEDVSNLKNYALVYIDYLLSLYPTLDFLLVLIFIVWISNGGEDDNVQCTFSNRPKDKPDKPPDKEVAATLARLCKIVVFHRKLKESAATISVLRMEAITDKANIAALILEAAILREKLTVQNIARQADIEENAAILTGQVAARLTACMNAEMDTFATRLTQNQADEQQRLAEIAKLQRELEKQQRDNQIERLALQVDFKTKIANLVRHTNQKIAEIPALKRINADFQESMDALQLKVGALREELSQAAATNEEISAKIVELTGQLATRTDDLAARPHLDKRAQLELDAEEEDLRYKKELNRVDILEKEARIKSFNPRSFGELFSYWWTGRNKVVDDSKLGVSVGKIFVGLDLHRQYAPSDNVA